MQVFKCVKLLQTILSTNTMGFDFGEKPAYKIITISIFY